MSFLLVVSIILGVILFIVCTIYWKLVRRQKYLYYHFYRQNVSCEPFKPLLGQLSDIRHANKNDRSMDYRLELVEKHGYTYVISFGPSIILMVIEPDMLADVFGRSHAQDYKKPSNTVEFLKPLIGVHNLLLSDRVEHERARKMLNPAFHFVKLQSMFPIIVEQTNKAIDALLQLSMTRPVIDFQSEFSDMTLTIIASSAFGKAFETMTDSKRIVRQAFVELLDIIEYRTLRMLDSIPIISQLPFWSKKIMDKSSKDISDFVDRIIADRRQNLSQSLSSYDDILDLLLSAVDAEGNHFSPQEIKDQALTFVLAGHETTSNLMTWIFYVLMTNEQLLQTCRKEVDQVLPSGMTPTFEDMGKLIVCEAVIHEALRLYPPATFITRECIREHSIGSADRRQIHVPVGAVISVNTYILHRREEFWPRPYEFDYTRWLRDPTTDLKPKLAHPFCYLPFGAGSRNCIGQNFALLEAKVILAMLLQRCNFQVEPGQKIVPDIRLTMKPKYGLRARVTNR